MMNARTGTGEKGEPCGLKQGKRGGKKLSSNSGFVLQLPNLLQQKYKCIKYFVGLYLKTVSSIF